LHIFELKRVKLLTRCAYAATKLRWKTLIFLSKHILYYSLITLDWLIKETTSSPQKHLNIDKILAWRRSLVRNRVKEIGFSPIPQLPTIIKNVWKELSINQLKAVGSWAQPWFEDYFLDSLGNYSRHSSILNQFLLTFRSPGRECALSNPSYYVERQLETYEMRQTGNYSDQGQSVFKDAFQLVKFSFRLSWPQGYSSLDYVIEIGTTVSVLKST